ncbi:transmembrane protein 249 isoform X3 [Choloepus didactylus]|uniref:transmembrane protein 249 isoform X3 n=1 Tax=Choloepus didactylus TaxID=27675 RepID=UPI0018A0FDD6|nr:transmembrane protein 249 isoform X3 [Choloepus didactylus]
MSGLPTTSGCKRFHLWALGCFCTERHLAKRLKNNSFYPFTQQLPNVFVLEYYLDTLWKGMVLFVVCLLLVSLGPLSKVCAPGPDPHGLPPPRGPAPAPSAAVRTVSPWPRRAAPCVRAPCTWSTCAWRSARTPTESASSSWCCAATSWSRWCWCSCRSATSKWNSWAATSRGNSTLTISTARPCPTGTWSATGRWGAPSARASFSAGTTPTASRPAP